MPRSRSSNSTISPRDRGRSTSASTTAPAGREPLTAANLAKFVASDSQVPLTSRSQASSTASGEERAQGWYDDTVDIIDQPQSFGRRQPAGRAVSNANTSSGHTRGESVRLADAREQPTNRDPGSSCSSNGRSFVENRNQTGYNFEDLRDQRKTRVSFKRRLAPQMPDPSQSRCYTTARVLGMVNELLSQFAEHQYAQSLAHHSYVNQLSFNPPSAYQSRGTVPMTVFLVMQPNGASGTFARSQPSMFAQNRYPGVPSRNAAPAPSLAWQRTASQASRVPRFGPSCRGPTIIQGSPVTMLGGGGSSPPGLGTSAGNTRLSICV